MTLEGLTKVFSLRDEPVIWLLAVLSLVAPVSRAQTKDMERDWLLEAKAAEQAREFDRAAECYTRFLKEHSGRADVLAAARTRLLPRQPA